jgi:hypothetical protein
MDDEMRRVLGAELFTELAELGGLFDHQECEAFEELSEIEMAAICDKDYVIALPFTGEAVLKLVSALHHASEADCDDCQQQLASFTGSFLGAMWTAVMLDLEQEDDDE